MSTTKPALRLTCGATEPMLRPMAPVAPNDRSPKEGTGLRARSAELRRTWDRVWERKRLRGSWEARWRRGGGRDVIHRLVKGVVRRELRPAGGQRILEAGSGSGLISLALAGAGCGVYLLDISTEALALAREAFRDEGFGRRRARAPQGHDAPPPAGRGSPAYPEVCLVTGRVEDLPFKDGSFAAAWSAGVLEHLPEEDRLRALREMFRVTQLGGKVLVLHPSARARVYRSAKAHADRHSRWQAGEEEPIRTMLHLFRAIPDAAAAREYSVGFLTQFHFVKYFFGFARPLYLAWCVLIEILCVPLGWLDRLPGYLLVTTARKEERPAARASGPGPSM